MPAGRPKKPLELKKIQGTYRKDRDSEEEQKMLILENRGNILLPEDAIIPCPVTIETEEGQEFWNDVIKNLQILRVIAKVDLKQVEAMCITLEKMKEAQSVMQQTSVLDEEFDTIEKRWERLSNKFDNYAKLFYINPAARTQLKLQDLTLVKTAQEVKKNQSAIGSLLNERL